MTENIETLLKESRVYRPTAKTIAAAHIKDYEKEFGLKVNVSGFGSNEEILAKLRAGGSKYDIISPTGYAVKTMADLGLIIPLTHELIPNLSNLSSAFKETDYDPGNKFSVAKDYGITSFYWMTDKTDFDGKSIKDCMDFLKSPEKYQVIETHASPCICYAFTGLHQPQQHLA